MKWDKRIWKPTLPRLQFDHRHTPSGHTLTLMCPALLKIKRPHHWRLWLQQSQCLTVWLRPPFLLNYILSPLRSVPEEMDHRASNTPATCYMAFPNRRNERKRQTEKNREIITQVCFDFQKWISMHADKILAAGGTTLESDRLLEQEGEIRSRLRGETNEYR